MTQIFLWPVATLGQEVGQTVLMVTPRTYSLLTELSASPDPSVRCQAVAVIGMLVGVDSSEALVKLTSDGDLAVRAEALASLPTAMRGDKLIGLLQQGCSDSSERVARHALALLGVLPDKRAQSALLDLNGKLPAARRPAWAAALARRPDQPGAELVRQLLGDGEGRIRASAALIVQRHPGLLTVQQRTEAFADRNPTVRARVLASFESDSRPQGRSLAFAALDDASPWVRRTALRLLRGNPPTLDRVAPLLADRDSTVRREAVALAGEIADQAAVAALIERLADRERLVAELAAQKLAAIGGADVEARLIENLSDPRDEVAENTAYALGILGCRDSIEPLFKREKGAAPEARSAVFRALGRIGATSVVPRLLEQVGEETGLVRRAINAALGDLGDRRALAHLTRDIHFPDKRSKGIDPSLFASLLQPMPRRYSKEQSQVAAAAVRALGQIGDPAAVGAIAEVAQDVLRNDQFWDNVAWSLGKLGDPKAEPTLVILGVRGIIVQGMASIALPDSTRIAALRSIERLKLRHLAPAILKVKPGYCSVPVRMLAAEVLTNLTGQRYEHRPAYRLADFFVRDAASSPDQTPFLQPICRLVEKN